MKLHYSHNQTTTYAKKREQLTITEESYSTGACVSILLDSFLLAGAARTPAAAPGSHSQPESSSRSDSEGCAAFKRRGYKSCGGKEEGSTAAPSRTGRGGEEDEVDGGKS